MGMVMMIYYFMLPKMMKPEKMLARFTYFMVEAVQRYKEKIGGK